MSYHGVVYVDMQPLLYPGATQIKGAYKINPYVENEFQEKVNHFLHLKWILPSVGT